VAHLVAETGPNKQCQGTSRRLAVYLGWNRVWLSHEEGGGYASLGVPGQEIAASGGDATHGWIENDDSGAFMLTGIRLPTAGCWKITGHYDARKLSFVVWVTRG
jgi:hypothetical protein